MKSTNELTIKIPALKRPNLKALQKEWSWIKSVERDTSPTKAVTFTLNTVLNDGEDYISGAEYEKRIESQELLGFQQAQWLLSFRLVTEIIRKVFCRFF